jgi:hypothetical protein
MADQYYLQAGQWRWNQLNRVIAQEGINADRHRENGDLENLSLSIQVIANAKAEMQALTNLHNEITAAEQANTPRQLTREETEAKPVEACDWHDTWRWTSQGETDQRKLQAMSDGFRKGMEQVRREKMGR